MRPYVAWVRIPDRACNARVFGSVVHGNDTEDSDLDILIDPTPETTLFDIGAIRHELLQLLGVRFVRADAESVAREAEGNRSCRGAARMSRHQQRLADYLAHILEAIERIDRYTEDMGEAAFMENQMAQDAVIRNFEIIGEASHKIETNYRDFAAAHPELPLAFAYQMRNAVAHGYFKVDREIM